jgi:hypothetical protein
MVVPFGYGQILGFLEYDVRTADAQRAVLGLNFWLGAKGPAVRGTGDVSFTKDRLGITEVVARWIRVDERGSRSVVMRVTRR